MSAFLDMIIRAPLHTLNILSFAIPHDIVAARIRLSHIPPHRGDAGNMARQALLRSLARSPATATLNATRTARTFATSARRHAEVELTVDGKKVSIEGMAMDGMSSDIATIY